MPARILFFFTAFALLAQTYASAQVPPPAKRQALKQDAKDYYQTTALPFLQAQRAELENVFSAEEQQTIAAVREKFLALRNENARAGDYIRGNFFGPLRPPHASLGSGTGEVQPNDRPAPTPEQLQARQERQAANKAHREAVFALFEELRPVLEAHRAEIASALIAIREEKQNVWRPAVLAMAEAQGMDVQLKTQALRAQRFKANHPALVRAIQIKQAAIFVLWDGQPIAEHERQRPLQSQAAAVQVGLYPNPASEAVAVNFELESPSDVTLEVLDANGTVQLKTQFDALEAGLHTEHVIVNDLPAGVYTLRLRGDGFTASQSLLVR